MKSFIVILMLLSIAGFSSWAQVNPNQPIIPLPVQVEVAKSHFKFDANTPIEITDEMQRPAAEAFDDILFQSYGFRLPIQR